MAQYYRQHLLVFLVAVLLFHSSRISAVGTLNKTGNNLHLEKENDEDIRMIGSDFTQRNQYPYMVALMQYNDRTKNSSRLHCGGSLISQTEILTAAHCVCHDDTNKILNRKQFQVYLGAHILNGRSNDAQLKKKIAKIKIHEKYNPTNWFNDIAILTLDSPVKSTKTISPICLPPQGTTDQFEGQMAIVKGWGDTEEDGSLSEILRHAVLKIISNAKCKTIYDDDQILSTMMCAYRRGKDTCQGDSGGPLVIETDDLDDNNVNVTAPAHNKQNCQWIQVGIVSWGDGCARKGVPGVYARVTSFLPWIKKQRYRVN